MISFKAALELGVDAIEFDVWLTADKVPVLILCKEKYPNIKLGVEIKEYTEENVDLTVPLLTVLGRL